MRKRKRPAVLYNSRLVGTGQGLHRGRPWTRPRRRARPVQNGVRKVEFDRSIRLVPRDQIHQGLFLDLLSDCAQLACSLPWTTIQRFNLEIGECSSILTMSPTAHAFASSCA